MNKDGLSIALWEDVISLCSDIYLNWNPNVYPFRQTIHSKRMIPLYLYNPASKMWNEEYSLEYFPQFQLKIPPHDEDFEVRVFFERHVDSLQQDQFFSLSYRLFSYSGDRVILPNEALRSHHWHPRELLSDVFIFEASKDVEIYVLVLLSQPLSENSKPSPQAQAFNFTLETFSFIQVDIIELPYRRIQHRETITNKFKDDNIGGNVLSPLFLNNPKYVLHVKEPSDFHFKVEGPDDSNLMLLLVPTEGINLQKAPLGRIPFQNFVSYNPGFYFQGFSNYKLHLEQDIYVLMISNQNYEKGDFVLYVDTLSEQISDYKPDYDPKRQNVTFNMREYEEPTFPFQKEIDGEWNKENSKGTDRIRNQDYQNFMRNPGYVVKVKHPTKAQFILQSTTYVEEYYKTLENNFDQIYSLEPPSLGVAVFEILEDFKFKALIEEDTFVPSAWGYYSKELNLKPNERGYLVVCLNYEKGYMGQYKLTVYSDMPMEDISDSSHLTRLIFSYHIQGAWFKENAGGCMSELTFYKNPGYEITPYSNCLLHIELLCPEPYPLCISLFETDGKRLTELSYEALKAVVDSPFFTQETSFLRVSLKKDQTYLLIPSTFRSGQFGKFEIKIESDEKIDIYDKKPIVYAENSIFKGEWTFETNMGPLDSPKFLENPSMQIKVVDPTLLRVHLFSPTENTYSIAIHLYEIHDQNELVPFRDSGSYTDIRMGCFIEEEIQPNQHGYLLIFSNFDLDKYGEFLVEISSLKANSIQVDKLYNFGETSISSLD